MKNTNPSARVHSDGTISPKAEALKPYVKPAFRQEKVFETMALACGKVGTQAACGRNRRNS